MGIEFIKKWTKTKVNHKHKKDLIHRTKFVMAVYPDPAWTRIVGPTMVYIERIKVNYAKNIS